MSNNSITTTEYKICDYSKHSDVNEYLSGILGEEYYEYRCKWKDASVLRKEFDFPLFLVFETMFRCNLKCIMCVHSSGEKEKFAYDGKLPFDIFEKIMEEASNHYCPSLTIGGTSEPTLDNRLIDMINLAKQSGFIDIMVNTNATRFTPELSRGLIKSGLTRLRIGFDGATASTYEKIRVGSDFAKVKDNIFGFMEMKDSLNSNLPVVRISCVHLSENNEEIEEFVKFWEPIVDYVSIQTYKPHLFTKERLHIGVEKKKESREIKCSQPFERLYIRGNGDVYACCSMVYGPLAGNVFKSSLYEIWNSDMMKRLRSALQNNNWHKIHACRECMINCYGEVTDESCNFCS